jgi:hypothetical protein
VSTVAPPEASTTSTLVTHHRHRASRHKLAASPGPVSAASTPVAYRWSESAVTAADLGRSWHRGCPVGPSSLRELTLTYWGFDNSAHEGRLVVNASVVSAVARAFQLLYAARFPIREMLPTSAFGGSDKRSMAHDNTSSFNCRYVVSSGPKSWSMHAYGEAIDIDTVENPYLFQGKVLPPEGKPYVDRSNVRPGMAVPGSAVVRAFAAIGWGWGGLWSSPDFQHFSVNGK